MQMVVLQPEDFDLERVDCAFLLEFDRVDCAFLLELERLVFADILLWFRNLTTDAVIDFLRMRRKQSSKN